MTKEWKCFWKRNWFLVLVCVLLMGIGLHNSVKHKKYKEENNKLNIVGEFGSCQIYFNSIISKDGMTKQWNNRQRVYFPIVLEKNFTGDVLFDIGWDHPVEHIMNPNHKIIATYKIRVPQDVVVDGKSLTVTVGRENLPKEVQKLCF